MTEFLIKKFVKNNTSYEDKKVRHSYTMLAGIVGIVLNVVLFLLKYAMGIISGSIAVKSSAFEHLSDSASSVITLFGSKLAAKPADKDHPFGHGRFEYIAAFVISAIIIVVSLQLLEHSIIKIFKPDEIVFSYIVIASLIISIVIKFWMSSFNMKIGKRISSNVLIATAVDSRNDTISTFITLISVVVSPYIDFPLDGILGLVVSALIFKNGFMLIRDTVDDLLGKPCDEAVQKELVNILLKDERMLGYHDLIVHNYGHGVLFASCHIEVDKDEDVIVIHNIIDDLEREVYESLGIVLTIHMDPIDLKDPLIIEYKEYISKRIKELNKEFSIHDFRMVRGETHTNLVFDIVVPFSYKDGHNNILSFLEGKMKEKYPQINFVFVVNFDKEF